MSFAVMSMSCPIQTDMLVRFNTLLDSSKTGLRLKPGVFEKDRAKLGEQVPNFDESSKPFILHTLVRAGKSEGDKLLQEYDNIGQSVDRLDKDLKAPYDNCANFVLNAYENGFPIFTEQLGLVRKHVEKAQEAYKKASGKSKERSPQKKPKRRQDQKDPMANASRMFAEEVENVNLIPNIKEVKASYAYHLAPKFAFEMAFQDLCLIKARASPGGIAPSTRNFDEAKTVSSKYLRAVARVDDN